MSESGEVRNPPNGTQSTLRSESFRDTSRFILKFMSQMTFDKICMVLAEVIGTATLLFLGCAGGVHWNGPPAAVQGPLNFGLTVMMIIQIFGHISYAILNPAVAVCAVINNLISVRMAIAFSIAELVGAALGYGMLKFFTPEEIFSIPEHGTCVTVLHPGVSITKGFLFEFFLTSALIAMICGVWDPRNRKNGDSSPLRIGLGIVALSIAGGPFTDASMNPARSFGPALWNWNWTNHWVFWAGPMLAGLLASLFYKFIFWRRDPSEDLPEHLPLSRPPKTEI